MKKFLAYILVLTLSLSMAACSTSQSAPETTEAAPVVVETTAVVETTEVVEETRAPATWELYDAAGMKKPMDVVIAAFQEKTGDTVNVNYSSSGALFTQIEQGQPCDLYFTADWIYVEKMEQANLAASSTKFLSDNISLVVSESAKEKVKTFEDLTKEDVTFTLCDPAAPVGVYAETGMKEMGLWKAAEANVVSRPSTVNQAAIMVIQDEVDAGLIFSSVANANGLTPVELMDQKYTGEIIFGTVTVVGENEAIANEFVEFANEYVAEFEKYGWTAYAE